MTLDTRQLPIFTFDSSRRQLHRYGGATEGLRASLKPEQRNPVAPSQLRSVDTLEVSWSRVSSRYASIGRLKHRTHLQASTLTQKRTPRKAEMACFFGHCFPDAPGFSPLQLPRGIGPVLLTDLGLHSPERLRTSTLRVSSKVTSSEVHWLAVACKLSLSRCSELLRLACAARRLHAQQGRIGGASRRNGPGWASLFEIVSSPTHLPQSFPRPHSRRELATIALPVALHSATKP
jgi:hypothetical protein